MKQYNQFCDQISLYNAGLLKHKPRHINPPKKYKSTIWKYFQRVETHIMLKLKHQLETEFNTTAYWLHDCLNFNTSLLNDEFKTHIKTTFKSLINSFNTIELSSIESNCFECLPILSGGGMIEDDE